jgi:hypothetical protein
MGVLFVSIADFGGLDRMTHGGEVLRPLLAVCLFAYMGGFAGGIIRRTGLAILGGVIIAWIILGIVGILLLRRFEGWIIGIPLGIIPGGFLGYRIGIRRELKGSKRRDPRPATKTGVWDREIDG